MGNVCKPGAPGGIWDTERVDRIIELDADQLNGSTETTALIRQGNTFVIIPTKYRWFHHKKNVEEQISALGEKTLSYNGSPWRQSPI